MLALVTGGNQGIGLEYARCLAGQGYDLLLVSNQAESLLQVAEELKQQYNVAVYTRYQNLAEQDAAEQIFGFCKSQQFEVEVLVNNAGVFFFNPLIDTAMPRIELMLDLHIRCVTKMCRLFGEDMARRARLYPEYELYERVDDYAGHQRLQCHQELYTQLFALALVRDEAIRRWCYRRVPWGGGYGAVRA